MFLLIETLLLSVQGVLVGTCPEHTPSRGSAGGRQGWLAHGRTCCEGRAGKCPSQGWTPFFWGLPQPRLPPSTLLGLPAAMSDPGSPHRAQIPILPYLRAHVLAQPQPIPVPTEVPDARCWGCRSAPAACSWLGVAWALAATHCPGGPPWAAPTAPGEPPGPSRALTVLSHSAALLLWLWLLPSPLQAISDHCSLAPVIILTSHIK